MTAQQNSDGPVQDGRRGAAASLAPLLYGDVPVDRWDSATARAARGLQAAGDLDGARQVLLRTVADPATESREALQSWQHLRALGVAPHDPAHTYGVVVDMPVGGGVDTLAAYADGTARYLNHTGAAIVWEQGDPAVTALVRGLVARGAQVARLIGPWQGARPALRPGAVRLSMLCAGGLHFGEGPMDALMADAMAGPVLGGAVQLLQALVEADAQARRAR